jgi:O-phosphoseryl-tRNA(Cys) synthetase
MVAMATMVSLSPDVQDNMEIDDAIQPHMTDEVIPTLSPILLNDHNNSSTSHRPSKWRIGRTARNVLSRTRIPCSI